MQRDLATLLNGDVSHVPAAARTASANGLEVDLFGGEGCTVVVTTGTITDGSHVFSLEETDTAGSGYTAVAAADIVGTAPTLTTAAAHDNAVFVFGYRGMKRYIRVVTTVTGTTTGGVYASTVLRSHCRYNPPVNP